MHDAVQFEKLGCPATVVISDAFTDLAVTSAERLGVPDYHHAVVSPHPVSSKDDDELRVMASAVAELVVKQLTTGR